MLFAAVQSFRGSRIFTLPVCQPVDGEQDWSESLLLSEDRLEEDPKSSQSQAERNRKISGQNTCGNILWGLLVIFVICKYRLFWSC